MLIKNLIANNLKKIKHDISGDISIGIGGLSGSGKSTFCSTIFNESLKRIVSILPKSEYRFLFGDILSSNCFSQQIADMPLVFYLSKHSNSSNPRSTIGTHTGIYREIRDKFANEYNLSSEFFSFNNSIMWCSSCKGRGSNAGNICKTCNGDRYSNEIKKYSLSIKNKRLNIIDIHKMSIIDIFNISDDLSLSKTCKNILNNLIDIGVSYLSLDRVISTISGGETVRVLLAEFMAQCHNSLIIIDEISIGLDRNTLYNVIEKISNLGKNNQIWLIDHSDIVLSATDSNLYFGPYSGIEGGKLVEKSPNPEKKYRVLNCDVKETYLLKNLEKRNLSIDNLIIPKNRIVSITGESGCGKSTLVRECIIPYFTKYYKNVKIELIGQDRNQSITSRSTIATFLDIKTKLNKYCIEDLFLLNIDSVIKYIKETDNDIILKLGMLSKLGIGYLTLNRKIQTLSTGEFQCIHLISKLTEHFNDEMVLVFDEPSKGLSQNILNLFVKNLNDIIKDTNKTILIIEHNEYILRCSDFIFDFGNRSDKIINKIPLIDGDKWYNEYTKKPFKQPKLSSSLDISKTTGIVNIYDDIDTEFDIYESKFKGGILKFLSPTAQWVYNNFMEDIIEPVITIDLEQNLYSKNTFLYEISGLINHILCKSNMDSSKIEYFDFYSKNNLCECCKGNGYITTIQFDTVIENYNKNIWNNLFKQEVMDQLKKFNFSKIKSLFKEIKKEEGYDLSKNYSDMSLDEKKCFWYGFWNKYFYDSSSKVQRKWQGLNHLITKYMKLSKDNSIKQLINNSKKIIVCPECEGSILNHKIPLLIESIGDIRDIIKKPIYKIKNLNLSVIDDICNILGDNVNLNMDVSTLPLEKQVVLKIKEILNSNLIGFTFVLKNTNPFIKYIENDILEISKKNKLILLNYKDIYETKNYLLKKYFPVNKINSNSYIYEIFGYKKIFTKINKIRKDNCCKYCHGTKVFREENLFDGVDITETPCTICSQTGINDIGLNIFVDDINVKTWLNGKVGNINKVDIHENIKDIRLMSKISDLNKYQIINILGYLNKNVHI